MIRDGKPKPEYIDLGSEDSVNEDCKGPDLLESEILTTIREMKKNKAVGVDNIPAEFWKVLGERGMKELVGLGKEMYEQRVWPEDHTTVIMMPLSIKQTKQSAPFDLFALKMHPLTPVHSFTRALAGARSFVHWDQCVHFKYKSQITRFAWFALYSIKDTGNIF